MHNKQTNEETENIEIDTNIHGNLGYNKVSNSDQWSKDELF